MMTLLNIKMYLWISWIILGLLGESGDTLFRGDCQNEGYFQAVLNNSRLKNYVISTQEVHSLEDCVSACLSDEHCSSCNFQVSGMPLHICELNSKSRSSARPGSLIREDGYQYYEIKECKETEPLCEKVGCQNGGTCLENCETLSFPHKICECPDFFTGRLCETRKIGNFLLNYNESTINDHTSVSVTGQDFRYLAVCVWVKPSTDNGVVFSYATVSNSREIALLFNTSNVVLHFGGYVIPLSITLPVKKWSHVCFILHHNVMLHIYYNGLIHNTVNIIELVYNSLQQQNITELPNKVTIKGTGTFVAAFDQISPGVVNRNSSSYLSLTRLYVVDKSDLAYFEVFRIFNEPYFTVVQRDFRVDWREFYQPKASSNTSALVAPSDEPDLGNFDLRFPDNPSVTIDIPYIPPLDTFLLSMWIKIDTSRGKDATIFELDSGRGTVLKLKRPGLLNDFEFFFNCYNSSISLPYRNVITDDHWFHLTFQWTKHNYRIHQYKHGSSMQYRKNNPGLNVTLPEIHNGTMRIGDGAFVGDITSLNLWSVEFSWNIIVSLALNPGNAAGNIFSWKSLREPGYLAKFTVPSTCHKRPGQFDFIFPEQNQNNVSYISMSSTYTNTFNSMTVAFWIKIPSTADEFTLISYAVPSQVHEFDVHFGVTGIWVYIRGNQRFIPLMRSKLLNRKWHHFIIFYAHHGSNLFCYHNGKQIIKDPVPKKSFISKDGALVVGAQQSRYKEVHESRFQFTGEISQLQIYRRTFSKGILRMFSARCSNVPGNFFRWADMPTGVKGKVRIRHQSECLKANNGEVD